MAGYNWMDDRERQIRERDGRGLGDYRSNDDRADDYRSGDHRSGGSRADSYRSRYDEDRTWDADGDRTDPYADRRGGRDRVFGERESGVSYGRAGDYPSGSAARGWRDTAYGNAGSGRSNSSGAAPRFSREDYRDETLYGGGRFYGDDGRGHVYREEYGAGGAYSPTRARYHAQGYGQSGYGQSGYGQSGYGDEDYDDASGYRSYGREFGRPASGGTGGYDYERGYGDAGRGDLRRATYGGGRSDMGGRMEEAGQKAGAFLRRTGRQVAGWFNAGGEGGAYDDLSATPPSRGDVHRGRGPQGYKRGDDRISEDAHERLTDDPWLDASNVSVSVSAGEVTLSGTVEHREAKHRAERIVEDISGVNHVQNNLRVAKGNYFTSASPGYGDSVLGAQIREAESEGQAPAPSAALPSSTTNGGKKN